MFSETESSSSGSIWSTTSDEVGDALQEAPAMATTAAQDSDSDPNTTKVGEETIMVNDSWPTRLSRSFRNYMNPGETAPGAVNSKSKIPPELEALQAVFNLKCNECTNCHYWMTCTTNKTIKCPGCHSTARTNLAPCYHLQVCNRYTVDQSNTYRTGLAYHIEYYKGPSKHPDFIAYKKDVQEQTNPHFSLPLPPLTLPAIPTTTSGTTTGTGTGTGTESIMPLTSTSNTISSADVTPHTHTNPDDLHRQYNEELLKQIADQRISNEREQKR